MRAGVLVILLFSISATAAPQTAWVARYSGGQTAGTNQAVALALDRDGNVIVSGHGTSTNGNFDYVTIKYSTNGTQRWAARHASASNQTEQVRSMAVDGEGNAIVTGTSVTAKYGGDGTSRWTAPYGGRGLALDPHGDVYVTGFSETTFATVKLHRDEGTNLWLRTSSYIAGQTDISQVIAVDSKSNVFVSGEVTCYVYRTGTYKNRQVIAYDANGNSLWSTAAFPGGCLNRKVSLRGVSADESGNVYVTGNLYGAGQTYSTAKYISDGSSAWSYYLDPSDFEGVQSLVVDRSGSVYLTGSSGGYATVKLTTDGHQAWLSEYGDVGYGYHFGNAIALDSTGNVYVTGQSPGASSGNDYATIKYDADGHEKWVQRYNGPANGDDVATAIAVAPDGSVYVTGWSTTSSNLIEITTIKYVELQSIQVQTNQSVLLQFLGTPGQNYRFQSTTNFSDWDDLGAAIADPLGLYQWLDTNPPVGPCKFYRTITP